MVYTPNPVLLESLLHGEGKPQVLRMCNRGLVRESLVPFFMIVDKTLGHMEARAHVDRLFPHTRPAEGTAAPEAAGEEAPRQPEAYSAEGAAGAMAPTSNPSAGAHTDDIQSAGNAPLPDGFEGPWKGKLRDLTEDEQGEGAGEDGSPVRCNQYGQSPASHIHSPRGPVCCVSVDPAPCATTPIGWRGLSPSFHRCIHAPPECHEIAARLWTAMIAR